MSPPRPSDDPELARDLPHDLLGEGGSDAPIVPKDLASPGVPFAPIPDDAIDPELAAIAEARTTPARRFAFFCRLLAIAASAALVYALRWDLRYAFASRSPIDLPADASTSTLADAAHHYVVVHGVPGAIGAVDYRRPLSRALHRLAPLVDRPDVYVEVTIPDGTDPTRFVPPIVIRGRLVPIDQAGARFADVRSFLADSTGTPPPRVAYLVEENAVPSFSAPGALIGLVALLLCISQWLLVVAPLARRRRRTSSTPS